MRNTSKDSLRADLGSSAVLKDNRKVERQDFASWSFTAQLWEQEYQVLGEESFEPGLYLPAWEQDLV